MTAIRIGTRASALARWQTDHVVALWRIHEPRLAAAIVDLSTVGDDQPDAPLEVMEGAGFFTSTLERALLDGRIDVAVHSFKDLPVAATAGLTIAAAPPRGAVEDVLCARNSATLAMLPTGARIGTSSLRRVAQLRALRRDLEHYPLRGNVPTRLHRVDRGDLDAVVLARAGVERLGEAGRISEVFPVEQVLPAPAQGALAVQTRAADARLIARLAPLDDAATRRVVTAEREVLHHLRGGCTVPVGAHARAAGSTLHLTAGVFALDGERRARVSMSGEDPQALGVAAARALLARGADAILAELERRPPASSEAHA